MVVLKLLLVLAVGLVHCAAADDSDELKAVVVLFRHGDRSPLSSWPNDVYFGNSSLWPDGYGQLNNLGKERHYKLGQWFRERYGNFLPSRYNRNDIYVQSTDVDRTLQSAAANLAGLYPPVEEQIWNENLLWQPVPIHTSPEDEDYVLTGEVPCPKYTQLYQEFKESELYQIWNEELQGIFQDICELAGYTTMDVSTFSGLFSTITIYKGLNLTLPEWTDSYWPLIESWAAKKFQWPTYTEQMARLRTGRFLTANLTDIPKNPAPKFLMLSAHDTTIGDRTNAMGVYPGAVPEFASTFIWELKEGSSGYYVNMYHKNSTDFHEVSLPECDFNCLLDDYQSFLEPITLNAVDWASECNE